MPLHEAVCLLTEPSAVVQRHDPQADRAGLVRLADELLIEISPLVAIEPSPGRSNWAGLPYRYSEVLLVNVTGIGDWFGNENAVLEATGQLLGRHQLRAAMAIADTPAAAWGLVRFGREETLIVEPGETAGAIDRLPVRALRIDHETAHQLHRLGVETVGQLRRLPRSGLATRLGSDLVRRIDQMIGTVEESFVMHHTEPEDLAVCELEYPTTDKPILQHRIGLLIDEVATRLAGRVRGALRLTCRLDLLENHPPCRIDVGLFAPTADADHLNRLMATSIENRTLPAMVNRITVTVDLSGPLQQVQTTLFDGTSTSEIGDRRKIARLIETVANRLGTDAVVGVVATNHPRPESAYVLRPLAGRGDHPLSGLTGRGGNRTGGRGGKSPRQTSAGHKSAFKSPRRTVAEPALGPLPSDPLRRPLALYRAPIPIQVLESERDGGGIIEVRFGRHTSNNAGPEAMTKPYRVLRSCGPERIEDRSPSVGRVVRDYYRIEVEEGGWFWLFRQWRYGETGNWFLHGRFG
jgi:protein ImuB